MKLRALAGTAGLLLAVSVILSGCAAPAAATAVQTVPETAAPAAQTVPETAAPAAPQKAVPAVEAGNYVYSYEEEIEGQKGSCSEYIILLDDATGFVTAQDTVGLHWTPDEIRCEDGSVMGIKAGSDGSLTVSCDGKETLYQRTYEDLPQELEERIRKSLDNRDYAGTYIRGDSADQMEFVRRDDGQYDIRVSLTDLCEMKGNGNLVDGGIEIDFTDPDGNHLYAVFFPDMEKYVLRITQSEYSQIPDQTDFPDFIRQ